jgi:hypothetical protein
MSLDDSDLLDFVEKATAEDRAKGIIEPEAIDFKKLVKEWKTRKKLDKEVPVEPIIVWAQLVGDKLELSVKKEIPSALISVRQNEIHVGELRITIVFSKTETAAPTGAG